MTVDSKTSSPFILFLFGEDGESVEDEELVAGSARFANKTLLLWKFWSSGNKYSNFLSTLNLPKMADQIF